MINSQLLHRYFNGKATEGEKVQILNWLSDEYADHTVLENYMESEWKGDETVVDAQVEQIRLEKLRNQLYPKQSATTRVFNFRKINIAVAACIATVALAATFYLTGIRLNSTNDQWTEIINQEKQMKQIVLPDSSTAWLNPESKLLIADFENAAKREARVEGEVFFDIKHNENRPFIVHAGSIETRVMGTAFNVEAYSDEQEVRVSLVSGKVAVRNISSERKEEILEPGEMISWSKSENRVQRGSISQVNEEDWTKGALIFNDVPLAYALERIAARYQLEVSYIDMPDLSEIKITTTLRDNHLNELLQIFPFVTPFKYKINGNKLYVTRK